MSYDGAITIFSPDGHLFQVEYATEAVKRGSTAIGVRGKDCIVIAVEKKSTMMLQDDRTLRKIHRVDEHVILAFSGLFADARVLVDKVRVESQSYKLRNEDSPSVQSLAKYIANIKQRYTQTNGRRPFGLSMIIGGFDPDGSARLFQTDPSGAYYEWMANTIGKGAKAVKEFLEANYKPEIVSTVDDTIKLATRAMVEVAQSGAENIEVAVLTRRVVDGVSKIEYKNLEADVLEEVLKKVKEWKSEEAAAKKK